jgi:hypothetical protein
MFKKIKVFQIFTITKIKNNKIKLTFLFSILFIFQIYKTSYLEDFVTVSPKSIIDNHVFLHTSILQNNKVLRNFY